MIQYFTLLYKTRRYKTDSFLYLPHFTGISPREIPLKPVSSAERFSPISKNETFMRVLSLQNSFSVYTKSPYSLRITIRYTQYPIRMMLCCVLLKKHGETGFFFNASRLKAKKEKPFPQRKNSKEKV
jgi:hypothetical protein